MCNDKCTYLGFYPEGKTQRDEGIDIPECDSVFITQPNNNIINIVQRMCRANRITDNKTKCQIFLWCSKNKTKKIFEYLSDNMNGVINDKVIKFNVNNLNIMDHITNIKIVKDNPIENTTYRNLYDIINNDIHKIMVIFDESNNIWFGMNDILKMLEYVNIDNAINTIKILNANKSQLKNIKIHSMNYPQKNLHPAKIFLNKNGLIELLTSSNKKSAKDILNKYIKVLT